MLKLSKYAFLMMLCLQMVFLTQGFARGGFGGGRGDFGGDMGRDDFNQDNRGFQNENQWNRDNIGNNFDDYGGYYNYGGWIAPPPTYNSDAETEEIFEQNESVPND
jgi:hypothetical protein